ncbi:hypothetical protein RCL2_003014600 [Rhizophagus clarus]|uniref:Uncharacterized protein n=1 Tax=Rhizophagus clarus TaxID=94130 RepID=A0A8H3MJA5_9GLOM|nr:hypothetical protein RCL2_003014600 [Rhizophagus clarus]
MVLSDADQSHFENFPTSSYIAKKLLRIVKQEKTYAVCPDCNTLYKVLDLQNVLNAEFKFKGSVRKPKMLFPVPSLKTQIISMYQHPRFVDLLQKLITRINLLNLYTDIYNGEVWKTFPSSLNNSDTRFFTNKTADSKLRIMINLD